MLSNNFELNHKKWHAINKKETRDSHLCCNERQNISNMKRGNHVSQGKGKAKRGNLFP